MTRSRWQDLPLRSIGDEALAELLEPSGCPLCRLRVRSAERYLDAILYESVNDRSFRADLDRGRGFCRPHSLQVLAVNRSQSGGSLGAAILFGAIVAQRAVELDAVAMAGGRRATGRALAALGLAPTCPVCSRVASAEANAIARLLVLAEEPAWAAALGAAELCAEDLVRFWRAGEAGGLTSWSSIADMQLARVSALARRLDAFAYHSSHDRRHLMSDEERSAADEAARFLGGDSRG
jgi:hypothetical protein